VDHRDDLLDQRAAFKMELPCKTEKQAANHHNMQTMEGADGTLNLLQEKGLGQRNKPPVWKSQ
jgi:hypothetical protein